MVHKVDDTLVVGRTDDREEEEVFSEGEDEPFLPKSYGTQLQPTAQPRQSNSGTFKALVLLCLFFFANVVISVFNKWLFNGPLRVPFFVTMSHQVIIFGLCLCISPFVNIVRIDSWSVYFKVLTIPCFFVFNIGLNNLSLLYTTLALNQLIRSFGPVVVAVFAYLIEGKHQSGPSCAAILFLVLGVTLSVATSPDLEPMGTSICLASVLGSALQTVMVSYLKVVRMDPINIIYHTSLISATLLLPGMLLLGEHTQLMKHVEEDGIWTVVGLTLGGGLIAFSYNLILLAFIQTTSSVYSSVAGSFKTILVIAASFLFFHQRLTTWSVVGILIACVAFVTHSLIMVKEKEEAQRGSERITPAIAHAEPIQREKILV